MNAKLNIFTAGAGAERRAVRAYLKRQIKKAADGYSVDGGIFLEWLNRRDERCNKRPGGVGK